MQSSNPRITINGKNYSNNVLTFKLLTLLVFLSLFSPPLIYGTSVRIDTIFILIFTPFLLVMIKWGYNNSTQFILLAFSLLTLTVGISLIFQLLIFENINYINYAHNFQGYLRPLLFGIFTACVIRGREHAEKMVKLLLFGMVTHGFFALIEFNNIQPLSGMINLIYRGDYNNNHGTRALGAFNMVHDLAYFSLYGFVFSLAVIFNSEVKKNTTKWAKLACLMSFVALLIGFSRGAWIAATAAGLYMVINLARPRPFKIIFILIFSFIPIILFSLILPPLVDIHILSSFRELLKSIYSGYLYLMGLREFTEDSSIGFITARLDWGWAHALDAWAESPLIGDLYYSQTVFIGDGGYTETLANHGLIGLFGVFAMLIILWKKSYISSINSKSNSKWTCVAMRGFVISFFFALFATGMLKERSAEILPVMLISLVMLRR